MNEEYKPPETNPIDAESEKHHPQQKTSAWTGICIAAAICSILYRIIFLAEKEQTAILFIGIPLILSILLSNSPKPTSTTGTIMRGITLCFLLFGILVIEGLICILIAAPLFYLIGAIIGYFADKAYDKRKFRCCTVVVLAIMSLEGITDFLSFDREESVKVERQVSMTPQEIRAVLAETPEFDTNDLPLFLNLGFPLPTETSGSGIEVGDSRKIHFSGGEGKPGDLIVRVTESTEDQITFAYESDKSHIAHWLTWRTITWKLTPVSATETKITLIMNYARELDPAWYFKPVERYGVRKAGEYFIDSLFDEDE